MQLSEFLDLNVAVRAKIRQGKQNQLFEILTQFGWDSLETQSAITIMVPPAFQNKIRQLAKRQFKYSMKSLKVLCEELLDNFVKRLFITPMDIFLLIKAITRRNPQKFEQIIDSYGIKVQSPRQYQNLKEKIQEMALMLKYKQEGQKYNHVHQILEQAQRQFESSISLQNGQYFKISSSEQLQSIAIKYRIFIKADKISELFEVVTNLGIFNQISQRIIKYSTYIKHLNNLKKILQLVILKQPFKNYKIQIKDIYQLLYDKCYFQKEDILKLIKFCYQEQHKQFRQMAQYYGVEGHTQFLKIGGRLLQLISHLNIKYRIHEIKRISAFCQSLIKQYQQKSNKITIEHQNQKKDYKIQLLLVMQEYMNQKRIEKDYFIQMVKQFYSGNQFGFLTILIDFGIMEQFPQQSEKLKTLLKSFVSHLSLEEEKQKQINNILSFLIQTGDQIKKKDNSLSEKGQNLSKEEYSKSITGQFKSRSQKIQPKQNNCQLKKQPNRNLPEGQLTQSSKRDQSTLSITGLDIMDLLEDFENALEQQRDNPNISKESNIEKLIQKQQNLAKQIKNINQVIDGEKNIQQKTKKQEKKIIKKQVSKKQQDKYVQQIIKGSIFSKKITKIQKMNEQNLLNEAQYKKDIDNQQKDKIQQRQKQIQFDQQFKKRFQQCRELQNAKIPFPSQQSRILFKIDDKYSSRSFQHSRFSGESEQCRQLMNDVDKLKDDIENKKYVKLQNATQDNETKDAKNKKNSQLRNKRQKELQRPQSVLKKQVKQSGMTMVEKVAISQFFQVDNKFQIKDKIVIQAKKQKKIRKHPFLPKNPSPTTFNKIKVLIIFYSDQLVTDAKIKKNTINKQEINLKSEQYNYVYDETHGTFIVFQTNKNSKQNITLQIQWNKEFFASVKTDRYPLMLEQYQNTCLLCISSLKNKYIKSSKLKNIGLFESIKCITKIFLKLQYGGGREIQMYAWLKMLFQQYDFKDSKSEDYQQYFSKIYISKQQGILHSKFFCYFFYAVYCQKSFQLFFTFELLEKMLLSNKYERIYVKRYQNCIDVINFYQRLQLEDILNKNSSYLLDMEKILISCLFHEPKSFFSILINVANKKPQIMSRINNYIVKQFKNNPQLNAMHYFMIKIKYFSCSIQDKHQIQINSVVINIIDDLIQLCEQKPIPKDNKIIIQQKDFAHLLWINGGIFRGYILRIKDQYLCEVYAKCKKLLIVSKNYLNFLNHLIPSLSLKCDILLKNNFVEMTMTMLQPPRSQMDIDQLQTYFSYNRIDQVHIKQIIQNIIKNQLNRQTVEQFEKLIQIQLQSNAKENQMQYDLILVNLDQQNNNWPKQQAKTDFLTHLFAFFLPKLKFIYFHNNIGCIDNSLFKRYTDTIFNLKTQIFRESYLIAILNEIKYNSANLKQQFIIHKFEQIYPYFIKQNEKKREFWINSYLQSFRSSILFQKKISNKSTNKMSQSNCFVFNLSEQ